MVSPLYDAIVDALLMIDAIYMVIYEIEEDHKMYEIHKRNHMISKYTLIMMELDRESVKL